MYFDEDLAEIANDPVSDVKKALSSSTTHGLNHACPQCFDNQRRLVCVPPFTAMEPVQAPLARYNCPQVFAQV